MNKWTSDSIEQLQNLFEPADVESDLLTISQKSKLPENGTRQNSFQWD